MGGRVQVGVGERTDRWVGEYGLMWRTVETGVGKGREGCGGEYRLFWERVETSVGECKDWQAKFGVAGITVD